MENIFTWLTPSQLDTLGAIAILVAIGAVIIFEIYRTNKKIKATETELLEELDAAMEVLAGSKL